MNHPSDGFDPELGGAMASLMCLLPHTQPAARHWEGGREIAPNLVQAGVGGQPRIPAHFRVCVRAVLKAATARELLQPRMKGVGSTLPYS